MMENGGELMDFQRVVILSDLHVAPSRQLGHFHESRRLADWMDRLAGESGPEVCLVLAGDIFDFLEIEGRPGVFDLEGTEALVADSLETIGKNPEMGRFFEGTARFMHAGGKIVLIPGNHDLEFLHPVTSPVLDRFLGGPVEVLREKAIWSCQAGDWELVVGHGHLGDSFNRVDLHAVHSALRAGKKSIPLPPGSELVLKTLNAFKRAIDPVSGERRFPFVDSLKPEAGVLFLLFYLDASLVIKNLPSAVGPFLKKLMGSFRSQVRSGIVLGTQNTEDEEYINELGGVLAGICLEEGVNATMGVQQLTEYLEGFSEGRPGTLANHSGVRKWFLRAALRYMGRDGASHFDLKCPSELDKEIIAKYLPKSSQRKVVVCGHTHAARHIELEGSRVYLNTGTWTELIDFSNLAEEKDPGTKEFIDRLEKGLAERATRLTYAEVTADGPKLCDWE